MLKTLAVLRTLFLVFIIGYTLRAMQFWADFPRTLDEQYSLCAQIRSMLVRSVWFAIGWIALETLIGWWLATRRPRAPAPLEASSRTPPPPLR